MHKVSRKKVPPAFRQFFTYANEIHSDSKWLKMDSKCKGFYTLHYSLVN